VVAQLGHSRLCLLRFRAAVSYVACGMIFAAIILASPVGRGPLLLRDWQTQAAAALFAIGHDEHVPFSPPPSKRDRLDRNCDVTPRDGPDGLRWSSTSSACATTVVTPRARLVRHAWRLWGVIWKN